MAVRGRVVRILTSELNGISLEVSRESGTVSGDPVLLRNIDPDYHPVVRNVVTGTVVAATGLIEELSRGSYRIPAWGRFECVNE
jgi:hypothetical protein